MVAPGTGHTVASTTSHQETGPPMLAMSAFGVFAYGLLALIIWIAIAFWPARVAGRKGHSFIGYFILSLFFFPLALILAYVVHDKRALA